MITTVEFKNTNTSWILARLYNGNTFDERIDEQLDTGSVQVITDSEETSFNDFCMVRVTITDSDNDTKVMYFCGFDTVERRGVGYYIHTIELVEPTRLLMGTIIEGRKVTQPIGDSAKKTLYDVVEGLLITHELLGTSGASWISARFLLASDENLISLLQSVVSPEFHWEAGTLLWECLLDIGNVINAIPRLTINSDGTAFNVITFDLINEETGEYEL